MTPGKKEVTKKYVQLPPSQAVPFTGFSFAKIESREPVAKKLKTFVRRTREEKFFSTGLIIAEWGEGKSDCFERYLKPEADERGDYAYLVSTSTIVNKLSRAESLFPQGPPESVTLAACTFYALRDELDLRNEDFSKFPDYREYKEPSEYVKEVLSRHLGKDKNLIYVFIDEFEEILAQKSEVQKKFMSGLKELLNGQLKMVHQGGKFAGRLHFILACTPHAYNRIRADVDLAQILGALDQRLSSNRIDLPEIEKEEAFKFLIDLLRFCYKHSLPEPLPFKSSGILNGIFTISQRNLRSLVQLLTDLLSAAALDGQLRVVNFEHFLNTLKGRPISVYGCSTQCIDKDLLIKIESALGSIGRGEEYVKIFRLLAGELKAFSAEEVHARTGVKDAVYRVNEMNQELRKIGISHSITRLNPLKEDVTPQQVLDQLNPVENQILLSTGRMIPIELFKDETIQIELDSAGEIYEKMFIPTEKEELQKIFDLREEEAENIYRILCKSFAGTAASRYFKLSKELTDQMFPSPLVLQLDFIRDRPKRMELWRKAMKELMERNMELRNSLIEVINTEPDFKMASNDGGYSLEYTLPSRIQVTIPSAINVITGRVSMNDAENIKESVNKERFGLLLLFHVGEIEENARAELQNIPNVLAIHLRPIRAQQLVALSLAKQERAELNNSILDGRLREILYELGFGQEFGKWLEKCRREGLLIEDLKRPSGTAEKSLVQAMTYYIQTIEEDLTLQRVFEESKKLQGLTLYGAGKKPSFAPLDIENAESLNEYRGELCLNGFLQQEKKGDKILTTAIEKRILENVHKGQLPVNEMERRFVILAQNEKLLEQVYFPILEAKGLIQVTDNEIVQIDAEEKTRKVQQRIEYYKQRLAEKDSSWWTYAHICISKEREDRIITLSDFDAYVQGLISRLNSPAVKYDEERRLRALRLIDELLSYFEETLEPMMADASNKGHELSRELKDKEERIETAIDSILQFYNGYSTKKYARNDVEDYVKLRASYDGFVQTAKAEYKKSDIEEGLEYISSIFEPLQKYEGVPNYFYYKRSNEQASFFNYKIYKMEEAERGFLTRHHEVEEPANHIFTEIDNLRSLGDESKAKLLKYSISEEYPVSSAFHQALLSYQRGTTKATPLKVLKLNDILDFTRSLFEASKNFNARINDSLETLEQLIEKEKTWLAAEKSITDLANRTLSFFDEGGELFTEASAASSDIEKVVKNHEEKAAEFKESIKSETELYEMNQRAKLASRELEELIDSLGEQQTCLQKLFEKCVTILKKHRENIVRFLDVLEKRGINVTLLSKPFEEVIGQAIGDIEGYANRKETKYTWKEVLENLDNLKLGLYNELKNILSEDQFNVLLVLAEASAAQEWFDMAALSQDLMARLNMTEGQIDDIIKSLLQAKMLKQGISLPI